MSKAVSRARNAAANGLSENQEVGIKIFNAGVATWSGANGVSFVDDEQSSILARELAQMLVVAWIGMHDPHIRHNGLGQDARDIAGLERFRERIDVIEFDNLRGDRRIDGWANVAAPRFRDTIFQCDERFVHATVIAPVVNQDFVTAGNLTCEPDRRAVGVSGAERELPVGQAESFLQFFAHPDRILGGQHQRNSASDLLLHCSYCSRRRVAGHGPSVAKTEIDVAMPVHVEKFGAVSLAHERRKSAGPFGHPVHGDSAQQRFAGALEQGLDLGRS